MALVHRQEWLAVEDSEAKAKRKSVSPKVTRLAEMSTGHP